MGGGGGVLIPFYGIVLDARLDVEGNVFVP